MKVGLIDVDNYGKWKTKFPCLPLMKLSAHHKARGDTVGWWYRDGFFSYDVVYKCKIFDFTPDAPNEGEIIKAEAVIEGGTGYGLKNSLPPEVERIAPDYSLYPQFGEAYGFLTRGCPRKCPFCIVSEKEGAEAVRVADLSDFYRGQEEIVLLDPNLLACREHETALKQLAASGAWVDFTQGLDVRLTTADNVALLKRLKIKRIHFAWDNPREDLSGHFRSFKALSEIRDYRKLGVYVLTNFNSTHEEDLFRVEALRGLGYTPYVMIYNKPDAPQITRRLQRWVNNKKIFGAVKDFADYDAAIG